MIEFWQGRWCGETSLAVSYPELFRFSLDQEVSVAEVMKFNNRILFWDVSFFRGVHARELEALASFMDTIYGVSVRGLGEYKMCWKSIGEKGFTVRDYCNLLVGSNDYFFPWKSIWKQKIPYRVAFFVWTVALGKCLTIDNLRRRKVWILDWCYMCKCNGESVDHLFLHCPVAMDMWAMVFGLFGVSWFMPQSVVGLLACWQGSFGCHRNRYIWLMVPHCLLWCLWRERNNRCFKDKERSISDLKLFFFRILMDWLAALRNQSFSSFIVFLDSCNFCS